MAGLNEPDFVLLFPERFDDADNAIAGNAEHNVHAPVDERLDQDIGSIGSHGVTS